nr:flagellin [Selenomonas ruminantium]
MDHVFGYIPGSYQPEDFNVLTQESREKLLGIEPEVGILDKGLTYLIDANTLIGAQINRMRNAGANITTAAENTQASESTLRDADMAKEMTGYTKANILSQTAQSMLAQANQNSSQVLSLLS